LKDHGVIFSPAMVSALRADRKTQTRRLSTSPLRRVEPGDRLWVRETFGLWSAGHDCELTFADSSSRQTGPNTGEIPDASLEGYFKMVDRSVKAEKRINIPAIHMPRWASRITLIVDWVRVEPLQAISGADAVAEGIERELGGWRTYDQGPPAFGPRESYASLWASLHTKEGQRWADNPQVVAIAFRVIKENIDRI
jgi:hypothetical protein